MSTATHDDNDQEGFEQRLLTALTEIDRDRPAVAPAVDRSRPARHFGRILRPAALGIVAALAITGAVVASGVLSPRAFEPAGKVQVAGDNLAAKGYGCAPNATVTMSLDGQPIGTVVAGADGEFSASVPIPPTTSVGAHQATASCVDAAGEAVVQTATITIVTTRPALGPVVNANEIEGVPGGQVVLTVGPVKSGSDVQVTLDGRPFTTLHASADGWLAAPVALPADISLGTHELRAVGVVPDGRTFDQTSEVSVTAK